MYTRRAREMMSHTLASVLMVQYYLKHNGFPNTKCICSGLMIQSSFDVHNKLSVMQLVKGEQQL